MPLQLSGHSNGGTESKGLQEREVSHEAGRLHEVGTSCGTLFKRHRTIAGACCRLQRFATGGSPR